MKSHETTDIYIPIATVKGGSKSLFLEKYDKEYCFLIPESNTPFMGVSRASKSELVLRMIEMRFIVCCGSTVLNINNYKLYVND